MSENRVSQTMTPEGCATLLMETMPLVLQFVRSEMRRQRASVLSVPQFRALAFLDRYPGASLSELAEHLGVTRATASAMIERLVQRSLVDRIAHPRERRQVVLKLTEAGFSHLQEARSLAREKLAKLLENLSENQLIGVAEGLAVLGEVFKPL